MNRSKIKVGFVSLGCSKNLMDTEVMLAKLVKVGYQIVPEDIDADIIIVNTCAFIESAKKEAIDNILDVAWLKEHRKLKGIVVTGCLAERYQTQIFDEIPEVDAVIGVGSIHRIVKAVDAVAKGLKYSAFDDKNEQGLKASVFSGYFYNPEIWVSPGSAMERSMTTSQFDSSNNLNMYALSDSIAAWPEGFYMCSSGATVTVGSTTLAVSNIGISSASVTFTDSSYNSVQVSLPVMSDSVATTGWAKNLDGTINLVAQRSAIITRDVLPSDTNQCWLGDSNKAWYQVVAYGFNSLSSREKKKDIEDFNKNATDIINGTKVVSFHYKDDEELKPRVGFIAEDTDKLLSTPTQDQFDLNNSVGLLLKAVQELSARIDKLEAK